MFQRLALAVALVATALALYGCPPPSSDVGGGNVPANATSGTKKLTGNLKIGHFASLTGNTAMFGQATDRGVQLAKDELNGKGGLTLDVNTLDDASLKEQAVPVVTRLISDYGATAIVGEVASSRSIAAAPVCDSKQVPMVSPSSTNPDVTVDPRTHETHPYVFRVCFTDPFQGAVMARFVSENLKLKQAALLKDVKNAYSVGLAEGFKNRFTQPDIAGQVVAEEAFSEGDSDFRGQLTRIKGTGATVLVVPGYYREAGLIIQQARELGLNIPVMGGDGWDSPTLTDVGGKYFTNCYFSNHFSPGENRPGVKEFVQAFQAKYAGETPNALAALGYDAVMIVADAANRAGSLAHKPLRDALESTKGYQGVTGQITIDAQHNAVKSAVVVRVETKNGKAVFPLVTTIAP